MTMSRAEQKLLDFVELDLDICRAKLLTTEQDMQILKNKADHYKNKASVYKLQLERTLGWIDCKLKKHPVDKDIFSNDQHF